jgi:4-amino-4-deoxy-L-arabinose transferase-like glycosyltransferase
MICQETLLSEENVRRTPFLHCTWVILLLILLLAAFLRLFKLGQSPPGLYQDEAVYAWNSYCLLKTGKDQVGVSWPIYYMRGLGCNYPTLYMYLVLPFQFIAGMNVYTTRLPGALGGILTVWLIYYVGKRLFNTETGLVAACLLAIDPWHHQQTRWGHEVSVTPLLGLVPLALMLWANMIPATGENRPARPFVAVLAGVITGICCYGYQPVRVFVPILLLFIGLLTLPQWWQSQKTRKRILSTVVFIITFTSLFGPLVWQYIFHPEGIGRHALYQSSWVGSSNLSVAIKEIASRYIQHFSPYFLFIQSDTLLSKISPSNESLFHLYMLLLMVAGLVTLFRKFKLSPSARVILAFVLAYPIGDCQGWGQPLNTVRSSPGLCSLVLLAAVGTVNCINWLRKQNYMLALGIAVIFVLLVIGSSARYFYRYYVELPRTPGAYHFFHTDLVEACKWLKPRFDDFDAVFCTDKGMNMPYIITLAVLGYEPKQWFNEPREFTTLGEWDYYTRYGKMYFMYDKLFKPPEEQYLAGRVLLIIRPGEIDLPDPNKQIIRKISRPDGTVTLWLCKP